MVKNVEVIAHNKDECVGCWACSNSCPIGAIAMSEDEEGFRYPVINAEKCVDCGACSNVCPSLHSARESGIEPEAFAFINSDEAIRSRSSSGGVFYALAAKVLDNGGIVYGAAFDEKWEVAHKSVENVKDLKALCGSKYLQSRIEGVYVQVRQQLNRGRQVLFSGTPCQCVALRNFLGKEYANLLLVDLICHGVPSPKVWRQYVDYRAKGEKISKISFRDKKLSWERFLLSFSFEKGSKNIAEDLHNDLYLKGFLQNLYLRPSCHKCKFCRTNRSVDITLGDYWGVQQDLPAMYDGKGTSLVMLYSDKGREAFFAIDGRRMKADFSRAVSHNSAMIKSVLPSRHREKFFEALKTDGRDIACLLKTYTKLPTLVRLKQKLKRIPGVVWVWRKIKK